MKVPEYAVTKLLLYVRIWEYKMYIFAWDGVILWLRPRFISRKHTDQIQWRSLNAQMDMFHDESWKPIYFKVTVQRPRSRVTKALPFTGIISNDENDYNTQFTHSYWQCVLVKVAVVPGPAVVDPPGPAVVAPVTDTHAHTRVYIRVLKYTSKITCLWFIIAHT